MINPTARNAAPQEAAKPIPVTAPQPLPVEITNAPKFRQSYNLNVTLNPSDPRRLGPADGLCFVGGTLPFLLVHSGGMVMRIQRGQYLPLNGADVAIENPYLRMGEVTITVNAKGYQGGNADQAESLNEYHVGVSTELVKQKAGFIVYPESQQYAREFLLKFQCNTAPQVTIIPNASADFEALAPAGVVVGEHKLIHPAGDELQNVRVLEISYDDAERNTWLASAGVLASNVFLIKNQNASHSLRLEPKTAVFLVTDRASEMRVDFTVRDEGQNNSGAVC